MSAKRRLADLLQLKKCTCSRAIQANELRFFAWPGARFQGKSSGKAGAGRPGPQRLLPDLQAELSGLGAAECPPAKTPTSIRPSVVTVGQSHAFAHADIIEDTVRQRPSKGARHAALRLERLENEFQYWRFVGSSGTP
ncbi:hypothetical protein KFL_001440100 [Klebsormidium nitens]|uniref:Uncharacterized protein n=1 Tax=Klebsormidium nitens TaxID=105231 RepID=A0A1Y1I021_KLENI|nr:hypothetical protein KFL_001440100 [Klebsormidium nitens]|eukprot:GAQ83322.1 hypothetical protein KFL_001440100 [Klebsormidium nitens]